MAFVADEEILQDFLVESGEILELLSEQLVELEQNPHDHDLLNAIFRGFHTVKGGAGFLQLDALVDCCHVAENVFDILRNGKRSVDADLMDVVLRALDSVNSMFEEVRAGNDPSPADPVLLKDLERFACEEVAASGAENELVESTQTVSSTESTVAVDEHSMSSEQREDIVSQIASANGDITDDEFEQLLDALDSPASNSPAVSSPPASAKSAVQNDQITDDEFEKLLDDLHGEGSFDSGNLGAAERTEPNQSNAKEAPNSDLISDNEFEDLLDSLHGAGNSPTASTDGSTSSVKPVSMVTATSATPKTQPSKQKPAAMLKPKPKPKSESIVTETTVRVDTKRLDDIMNMVGELVLVRNRLKRLGDGSQNEPLQKAVSNLDVVTGDLQSAVMKTRMQPIKKVFGRFPRVVRDLARNLDKEVKLVLQGEETDLDKNLVEALSDPLVHLVRNAVDHGIEIPEIREANGKARAGEVILSAQQEGDHILLLIRDDGAGMDPNVLRRKAVEKGLYDHDAAERLSDNECFNLIFAPGFSTKDEISDVSGRGVGMDVVKTKITQLNGTVNIDSELGVGSTLTIKVPLTLAIMPTLMVKLEQQSFAFPLVSVVEIFHLDLTKTNVVDGQECIVVRENVYPLFHIKRWLVKDYGPETEAAHVVIVAVGTQRVGFIVDQLVGQEEVVIKPLGGMLHGTAGMAGATITGDGRIALILDIPSLLQRYA